MSASETTTYFAQDGSYGYADSIVLTDTSSWTEPMWSAIDDAGDADRRELAKHFADSDHNFDLDGYEYVLCQNCELSKSQLGITD